MPCRSDYMEPTAQERESKLVAQLIAHVISFPSHQHIKAPEGLGKAITGTYGNKSKVHEWTAFLCGLLNKMGDDDLDKIVYNGRDPWARKLADWKDRHAQFDMDRLAKEAEEEKRKNIIRGALNKLTAEEKKALGLKPRSYGL